MITFNSENKCFHLSGSGFSYVFRVNTFGALENLHFGGKTDCNENLDYLSVRQERGFSPCFAGSENRKDSPDSIPCEYPAYGGGDFRLSAVLTSDSSGNRVEHLKYKSHRIEKSKPVALPMPLLRGGETLVVTLSSENLEIDLHYTVYSHENALTRRAEIKNISKQSVKIERFASMSLDLPSMDYDFITLWGKHCGERNIERAPLRRGVQSVFSLRGSSSHHLNPFFALCNKNADEFSGEVYGFNLVYGGSFLMQAECGQTETTRVFSGFPETDFSWELQSGEKLSSPETVIVYSAGGLSEMSRSFHDLYREYLINPSFAYKTRPIVINNWESTYFNFDTDSLCALIDSAKPLGIDTFVLDDGWFGKRNNDRSSLGDWYVNTAKLKGGLAPIIEHCKKNSMGFGLWFEPEMISPDSDLFRAHPEYAIKVPSREYSLSRSQLVLDLANKEVVDYLKNALSKILSENDISYVKWDYNRNITDAYSESLPPARQQEIWHRYMLGLYELLHYLTNKFPHILFEGCSGGGGRFDPSMLYYFPQNWTSDNSDAFARTKIQYGTSLVYPLSSMTAHVSVCPNHQTGRITPLVSRGVIASCCHYGYELNVGEMSEAERETVKLLSENFKNISPLILRGDLFRLIDPFKTDSFGFLVLSKDRTKGFFAYMKGLAECNPAVKRIKFPGLAPDKTYKIKPVGFNAVNEESLFLKGSTLLSAGMPLPVFYHDMAAALYLIDEAVCGERIK